MSGTVVVDREALRAVLQALIGPRYRIRELQATLGLPAELAPNPIQQLIDDYNALTTHRAVKLSHLLKLRMLIGPRPQQVDGKTYVFDPSSVPDLIQRVNEAFNDMMDDQT